MPKEGSGRMVQHISRLCLGVKSNSSGRGNLQALSVGDSQGDHAPEMFVLWTKAGARDLPVVCRYCVQRNPRRGWRRPVWSAVSPFNTREMRVVSHHSESCARCVRHTHTWFSVLNSIISLYCFINSSYAVS